MFFQSKRQVFELPRPEMTVTEYQIFGCKCHECGQISQDATPAGVHSAVQYNNMAKSLAVLLNNEFKLPFKKIRNLFQVLYGCPMKESTMVGERCRTIVSAQNDCYDKLSETESRIKKHLQSSHVGHVDETGVRIHKKLMLRQGSTTNWLHVFSSLRVTCLFVHPKRGKAAIDSVQSIVPAFKNWLVHDCWNSYFHFRDAKHALCNAHVIRELQSVIDNDKNETSYWATKMQDFLLEVHRRDFSERIKNQLFINQTYYKICRQGLAAEPPAEKSKIKRGRIKNSKARNLLHRLIKHKHRILALVAERSRSISYNENRPFTNNLAEWDIRPAKIKLKISNVFRSDKGANSYARIQSFISTARKNSKNIPTEIYNTSNEKNFITQTVENWEGKPK
jgi:transposase